MSTVGIKTEVTVSNEKTRTSIIDFYKGISTSKITSELPCSINATETKTIDVSGSNYILMIPEESAITSGQLEVTIVNSELTPQTLKLTGVGFLLLNCDNMVSFSIKNTHATNSINIYLMY